MSKQMKQLIEAEEIIGRDIIAELDYIYEQEQKKFELERYYAERNAVTSKRLSNEYNLMRGIEYGVPA